MFKKIDEDEALMVENGVYKPAEVYEYRDGLYLKTKGGFVRLKANGSTSHANVKLMELHREGALFQDQFGRLCVQPGQGRREIAVQFTPGTEGLEFKVQDVAALPKPEDKK